MSAEIKNVQKVLVGDDLLYQDSDGWIPLKNTTDVVDGQVLFKDNLDGTGSLLGAVTILSNTGIGSSYSIIELPKGYQFADNIDWNISSNNDDGLINYSGSYGNGSAGVWYSAEASAKSDRLQVSRITNAGRCTFRFTQADVRRSENTANPATIGIKKV